MPLWTRVSHEGREWFGTIEDDTIVLHEGDMFANPRRPENRFRAARRSC